MVQLCMANLIDMAGKRFGRWLVLKQIPSPPYAKGAATWHCKCDCGAFGKVLGSELRRGTSKSCGCMHDEGVSLRQKKHGYSARVGNKQKRAYTIWQNMVARCHRTTHHNYRYYGGRGILVCDKWRSFENFLSDIKKAKLRLKA